MNKINQVFANRGDRKLLSLYFCAGCPTLDGTADVIKAMERHGIDFVEVGMPFSDPLADGPVIQSAGAIALKNGMTTRLLLSQLKAIKDEVSIPLIFMGYLNPILHYGYEKFFADLADSGVSGVIIPDLPFADYQTIVKPIADRYDIRVIMMITPETSDERIRFIDDNTDGFIYMVSSASVTGAQKEFDAKKAAEAPAAAEAAAETKVDMNAPVTGPVLTVPMPGTIVELKVKPGAAVKKGQTVLVYDAMKMENDLEADKAGTVKRIFVNPGQAVAADAVVVEFE